MKYRFPFNFWQHEDSILWAMLVLSIGVHLALFSLRNVQLPHFTKRTVEIDLTHSVRRTAEPPAEKKPAAKPKEWVKPTPEQIKPYTPPPAPVPQAPEENQASDDSNGSETSLSKVTRLPQLLNLADLDRILQRFYPEEERDRSLGGTVVLDLHLDTEGKITSVDIVQSGGPAFDQAAQRAARLLRFTPAYMGSDKVSVKIRQAIQFKPAS
jgi:TonB family protein